MNRKEAYTIKYNVKFNDDTHKEAFYKYLKELHVDINDVYRIALVYVLTITEDCRNRFYDCYDIQDRCVKQDALHHGWVTGTDARAIRMAFNLFNGGVPTALIESGDPEDNLYDRRKQFRYLEYELLRSTPCELFGYSSECRYFIEGIKLRFPEIFPEIYE